MLICILIWNELTNLHVFKSLHQLHHVKKDKSCLFCKEGTQRTQLNYNNCIKIRECLDTVNYRVKTLKGAVYVL